jgi:NAD-specific glutamate dehydrogenase
VPTRVGSDSGLAGWLSCSNVCSILGGVTSSSLEVLAGLALSTEEYTDLMIFKDGKPSEFYQSYVKDIQGKIVENAANEFSCIWREHARLRGVKPRTTISDELSQTLNNLQAELEGSDLYDDVSSRNGVMRRAIPKTLIDLLGLDKLLTRLPEAYQRALFSSWVASHYVSFFWFYYYGLFAYCFHLDLQIRCQWLECRFLPLCKRSCWPLLIFFLL